MPYAAQWYARENPGFTYICDCGLGITGQSEKGLHTLMKRHREKGIFHLEYTGEKQMTPVPEGIISTSTGPAEATPTLEEAIVAADAEEATEEYVPEATEEE